MTFTNGGMTWTAWARALAPDEVVRIARDLEMIDDSDVRASLSGSSRVDQDISDDVDYVVGFLNRARDFAVAAASDERGFAYLIG